MFAYRARPEIKPVWIGASQGRTKMLVANRKPVSEFIIKWDILSVVITECQRHICIFFYAVSLYIQPFIISAVIARVHLVLPGMWEGTHPGGFCVFNIQTKRSKSFSCMVGL